jgi:ATP-binding cassette, sub-family E, member 1
MIRTLINPDNYILAVEHDLSILDYLSDKICVMYGVPGVYGVVSIPYSVREGINVFLEGNIPKENSKFRDFPVTFHIAGNKSD